MIFEVPQLTTTKTHKYLTVVAATDNGIKPLLLGHNTNQRTLVTWSSTVQTII